MKQQIHSSNEANLAIYLAPIYRLSTNKLQFEAVSRKYLA